MKISDIDPGQISGFLLRLESEGDMRIEPGITSRECATCSLLARAFTDPEVMPLLLRIGSKGVDVPSIFFGFHLAFEFMQSVEEAGELRKMSEL